MHNDTIEQLELELMKFVGLKESKEKEIKTKKKVVSTLRKRVEALKKIRLAFIATSEATQTSIKHRFEDVITDAIQSIYERNTKFRMDLIKRGNKLNCVLNVEEEGNVYDLEGEEGGGILDVISLIFRVLLWQIQSNPTRPVFVLDEPMKFVGKGSMLDKAGSVLRQLSYELGIQLIIFTHEPQLVEIADKTFQVKIKNGRSSVKEI